jgi:integrase
VEPGSTFDRSSPVRAAPVSIKRVAALKKTGRYGDGNGLYLQVSKWKSKAWVYRYQLYGKTHEMGLGPYPLISLAEARKRIDPWRTLRLDGIDPIKERKRQRMAANLDAAKAITFGECADRYIKAHEAAWRNEKHRYQWRQTLDIACRTLGDLPVAAVDTALVVTTLEPIWTAKPETASRLRQRIEAVLHWATARGFRTGPNPATWRGHLDKLLPKISKVKRVQHHPALPYAELPHFMAEVRANNSISARALEFTILTACRTSEVINATWEEIDQRAKTWTVPPERMKASKEHRIPLSDRALAILASLPREDGNPFVFIGGAAGKPLSNMAMLQLLKGMRPGLTVHGFRSTFRDWTAECTAYPNHVVEKALAHIVADKVEAAYRRGDLFEKRRRLMNDWARYCAKPDAKETSRVVALRT